MTATQQTKKQIERAIRKVIDKFPSNAEAVLTDIHLQVKPESGELLAFNDDMEELTRIVVDQWLEPTDEDLYEAAENALKPIIKSLRADIEKMSILHPFSFVMMGEDEETMADIYIVDDDTIMIDTQLLKDFDKDLDQFLEQLMKE